MRSFSAVLLAAAPLVLLALRNDLATSPQVTHKGHRHHHHGHHHKKHSVATAQANISMHNLTMVPTAAIAMNVLHKMQKLDTDMAIKVTLETGMRRGELELNGPLPADFSDRFAKEVAKATGCKAADVRVLNTTVVEGEKGVDEIIFEAPPDVIKAVAEQAADPDSKLAKGPLRIFLVEKAEEAADDAETKDGSDATDKVETKDGSDASDKAETKAGSEAAEVSEDVQSTPEKKGDDESEVDAPHGLKPEGDAEDGDESTPVEDRGIDVDTSMPYGELEPFGREDTANELTKGSIRESDEMVDQLERAEVAEEKRAVFRALTRLRGAAITSFDGVARSQTGNIDSYARMNHWRSTHPVRHLADEESDVGKWAFPDNSDF